MDLASTNTAGCMCLARDPNSTWFYTLDMGFLWSSSTVYPFLWNNTGQTWLYYIIGSQNPRVFYNYKTGQWETHNP